MLTIFKNRGFSLVESLLVLLLISVLAAIGLPNFTGLASQNRHRLVREKLVNSIRYASSWAHSSHQALLMSPIKENDWSYGWEVVSAKKRLLKVRLTGVESLHMRSFPQFRHALHFPKSTYQQTDNATFWLCERGRVQWAIMVNKLGLVTSHQPDPDGVILDGKQKSLLC